MRNNISSHSNKFLINTKKGINNEENYKINRI